MFGVRIAPTLCRGSRLEGGAPGGEAFWEVKWRFRRSCDGFLEYPRLPSVAGAPPSLLDFNASSLLHFPLIHVAKSVDLEISPACCCAGNVMGSDAFTARLMVSVTRYHECINRN